MKIKSQKDFWSGLMFVATGLGFAAGATNYSFGTSARPGPGYFPFGLGILLAILGVIVLFLIVGSSVYRIVTTRQRLNQVKLDVRALLATIELLDLREAHWKDCELQGNTYATKELGGVPALRTELLAMLAEVHAGEQLQPKQRGRLEEIDHFLAKE